MSLRKFVRTPWQLTLVLALAYGSYALWSVYRGGAFGYHDLSLINDFFSNAWTGRPFWITDEDVSHLSIHFTPTLFLLVPFFLLSGSQGLFLQLGLIALFGSLALHVWHFDQVLGTRHLSSPTRAVVSAAWAIFLLSNVFTRAVAASAHYELFYPLFASAALIGIMRGLATKWCVLFTLLAAGVRPDGGMFLAVQALALLWLPRVQRPHSEMFARRVTAVGATGLLYLVVFLTVISPLLGTVPGTRFWAQYGDTWWEVGWTILRSPGLVVEAIANSGLPRFNASFGLIQWLVPPAAFVANVPGVFFALAGTGDKQRLWFYNSAFLLPGLFICAQAGFVRLLDWTHDSWSRWPRLRPTPWILAASGAALVALLVRTLPATAGSPALVPMRPIDGPIRAAFERHVAHCDGRSSVATDFRSVVFVPNGYQRYLLRHFERAQVVLVPPSVDLLLLGAPSREELLDAIQRHPQFREAASEQGVQVFVRDDAWATGDDRTSDPNGPGTACRN